MTRNLIIGGGELGQTIYSILGDDSVIFDTEESLHKNLSILEREIGCMHICFPYQDNFITHVDDYITKFDPDMIIIHSTVPLGTTYRIQVLANKIPVVYSPVRGVHTRFEDDMKEYTKFYATVNPLTDFDRHLLYTIWSDTGVKLEKWDSLKDLELAKVVVDTTYYGWLIAFRFAADQIAESYGADKEKIWDFAQEIHESLGNRPKMYSNIDGIGGHCVLPNLELNHDASSEYVKNIINILNAQHRRKRTE